MRWLSNTKEQECNSLRIKPNSPGQGLLLQLLDTLGCPTHWRPPLEGTGLVHVLERTCLPSPHVVEHVDHPDQLLQPSVTANKYNIVV